MQVLDRAAALERAGERVVHFEVGEPDFTTAEPIVRAGETALEEGFTRYTPAAGLPELREAIAGHYATLGVTVTPERILVTAGASGGLTLLAALLLNPGDELLVTDPGYPCNEVFVRVVGGVPVPLIVRAADRYQPTAASVAAAWGPTTRGVLLASPANPTGTMLAREGLAEVAETVRARDGVVILDEIYQGLVPQPPYATGLAVADDLIVLNSFSKFFGMTGWRLGWIVLPETLTDGAERLAQNLFICPSAPAQRAALAAFGDDALAVHRERAGVFARRGALLSEGLTRLGFSIPVVPDGAFYLYVDVSHTGLASDVFCHRLLEEFHVAATPGHDFGRQTPERFVRFAYTTSEDNLRLGLERIEQALTAWGVSPPAAAAGR